MVESTREDGKMVNNTESELTPLLVVKQSKESGKKVKDFTGFKINETIFRLFNSFKNIKNYMFEYFLSFSIIIFSFILGFWGFGEIGRAHV
jgi:hypothetical protein